MEKEIKQSEIKKVIKDILVLRDDLVRIGHRVTPDIAGFYGEVMAWQKLQNIFGTKGYKVKFGSGQSRADIELWKGNKKINVEVKTSRLKKEGPGTLYGFAINIKKCKLHPEAILIHPKRGKVKGDFCYFDYLLAVTLSDDLRKVKFYVFPKKFLGAHEQYLRNRSRRFSSATHRIIFVEKPSDPEEITKFDRHLVKNRKRFESAWHLIK